MYWKKTAMHSGKNFTHFTLIWNCVQHLLKLTKRIERRLQFVNNLKPGSQLAGKTVSMQTFVQILWQATRHRVNKKQRGEWTKYHGTTKSDSKLSWIWKKDKNRSVIDECNEIPMNRCSNNERHWKTIRKHLPDKKKRGENKWHL